MFVCSLANNLAIKVKSHDSSGKTRWMKQIHERHEQREKNLGEHRAAPGSSCPVVKSPYAGEWPGEGIMLLLPSSAAQKRDQRRTCSSCQWDYTILCHLNLIMTVYLHAIASNFPLVLLSKTRLQLSDVPQSDTEEPLVITLPNNILFSFLNEIEHRDLVLLLRI